MIPGRDGDPAGASCDATEKLKLGESWCQIMLDRSDFCKTSEECKFVKTLTGQTITLEVESAGTCGA